MALTDAVAAAGRGRGRAAAPGGRGRGRQRAPDRPGDRRRRPPAGRRAAPGHRRSRPLAGRGARAEHGRHHRLGRRAQAAGRCRPAAAGGAGGRRRAVGGARARPPSSPAGTARSAACWRSPTRSSDGAAELVERLHAMGLEVAMLTGDNARTAEAIARRVGIDRVLADVLPADKAAEVARLQPPGAAWSRWSGTASTTRRPWSQADLGIAIGTGTDVAIEASDLTLLRGDLHGVATAIALSRRTYRTIVAEPGLGVRLQRGRDPAGRAGPAEPDRRRRRHGLLQRQRGRQLAAPAALRTCRVLTVGVDGTTACTTPCPS